MLNSAIVFQLGTDATLPEFGSVEAIKASLLDIKERVDVTLKALSSADFVSSNTAGMWKLKFIRFLTSNTC